jgi:hypothetical protein
LPVFQVSSSVASIRRSILHVHQELVPLVSVQAHVVSVGVAESERSFSHLL